MFRTECPLELSLPIPAAAVPAADAVVQFNAPGAAWLNARLAREDLLAGRLADAAAACPAAPVRP